MASAAPRRKIAIYTDADVHGKLAEQIRTNGFDAISAFEAGNTNLNNSQQLDFAIKQGRTILTHNARHFEPLVRQYWKEGKQHHGVIGSEQLPVGELLRRVLRLLNEVDAEEMMNSFRNLGEFK